MGKWNNNHPLIQSVEKEIENVPLILLQLSINYFYYLMNFGIIIIII